MKLTALEIKQQSFDKAMRGFDMGEVQAFLNLVSNEWEHLVARNRELEQEIDKLQNKLSHYERVESTLHETLQTARESAEQKLEVAKNESRNIIERAEMEADTIVREAALQRRQIRMSILSLLDQREQVISGIRSYLDIAQNSLNSFTEDEARLFTKPLFGERGDDSSADAGSEEGGDLAESATGDATSLASSAAGVASATSPAPGVESTPFPTSTDGEIGDRETSDASGSDTDNDSADDHARREREFRKANRKPGESGEVDMDDILDQID